MMRWQQFSRSVHCRCNRKKAAKWTLKIWMVDPRKKFKRKWNMKDKVGHLSICPWQSQPIGQFWRRCSWITMLQSHRIEVLTNTGGVWKKKWRRWAFYGLQRPLERRFLGKTRTFRPNELPQGFEILQRLGTQLLSLNPKKLQILVWDFEPLFKVTSGSLGSATGVSKKRTYFIPRTKMQQDLRNGCPVIVADCAGELAPRAHHT